MKFIFYIYIYVNLITLQIITFFAFINFNIFLYTNEYRIIIIYIYT